jgi:hypothetical protein
MTIIRRLGLAGALASTLAFGCAQTNEMLGRGQQTWNLQTAPAVPAAQGKVEVATGEKGNRDIKVEAKHLAQPETAFPGTSTYVVWLKPTDGKPLNIGVLKPDKDLKATLETSTAFTAFEIMVTAENGAQPTSPTMGREVLRTNVVVAS